MATFIKPKKRKLSKSEAREVAAFKLALKYLTKDHAEQTCGEFSPHCPACTYNQLVGFMRYHIDNLEY